MDLNNHIFMGSRNRTPSQIIGYGLYLYLVYSLEIPRKHYIFTFSKDKSCLCLKLDAKVQIKEISKEKEIQSK